MDAENQPADARVETSDAQGRAADDPVDGAVERVRIELPVSRSRAFDAYVRDFGSWWQHGRSHRADLHVEQAEGGGIVEHLPNGDESRWGAVHELEVGVRIRHSYRHAGEHEETVTAEFHDAEHGGTVVELSHDPWHGSTEEREALQEAWATALRRLSDDATST